MIETEIETQARVGICDETIAEYVAVIRAAQEAGEAPPFPPVDLFFDGAQFFVGDGWHRIFAWQQTSLECIPAIVQSGGERDALLFALGANQQHGLKRSNEDKWRAVEIMLADLEWAEWSNHKIAEACGVSQPFVGKVRRKCEEDGTGGQPKSVISTEPDEPTRRLGRDGKRRKVKPAAEATSDASPEADAPAEPAPEEETGPNLKKLAEPYRASMAELQKVKKALTALAAKPEGAHLARTVARINASIDDAKSALRQAEPHALCGKCEGAGCQHCSQTGFWTRFVAETQKREPAAC